jgi:membrane protein implicated in regulation of membrane protease activity
MNGSFRLIAGAMPLVWLLIAIGLGIFEAATVQLVAIWFAIGALAAILPASMGGPLWLQLTVFIAVSTLSLAITRPLAARTLNAKRVRTNADSLVGQMGVVVEGIDNLKGRGRVHIGGLDWSAVSEDGQILEADEQVLIKRIEGVKLVVERII